MTNDQIKYLIQIELTNKTLGMTAQYLEIQGTNA